MDSTVVASIIGALAAIAAAVIGYAATRRKETRVQKESWYTRWAFDEVLHEVLQLKVTFSGAVTGTRTTTAVGSEPKVFHVTGHKQGCSYWLEYRKSDGHGGGAMTMHMYTNGKLMGLVTSVHCKGTTLLCRVNHWLPYEQRSEYQSEWCDTVACVVMPTGEAPAA